MRGNIQVLSSFADGPSGLSRALKKGLGPLEVGAPSNIVEREEVAEDVHSDPATLQNKGNIDTQRQAERAQTTLNSFSTIAQWLKPYPGRKNIFWLSAGFPLEGQPFGLLGYDSLHPAGPGDQVGERSPMQQKTDKELQSARIAIYPIDSAGVAISDIAGETSADTKGNFRSANPLVNATKDNARKAAQHSEMLELAAATGGVARFDNDIAAELQGAIHQAESYYTLSYTPHDTKWDGTYHRIHLESDKPGIQLIYRQGYYARDAVSEPPPSDAQFLGALQPGQPSASSLVFTATLSPSATEVDISYAIDASSLQFARNSDGKLQADLDCAILEFNAQGKVLEKALTRLAAATTPDQLAQFTSKPLEARQTIALKPGAAILVLGVQDRTTGRFGTLQLSLPER